jgi:DNA-binding XRE family transcriptional regulator
MATPQPVADVNRGQTLAKAALRAAYLLGLTQAELAPVLGLSRSSISRLAAGNLPLAPEQKAWELAALFVRLFRSLDAIVGPSREQARAWLDSDNAALGAAPRTLIATTEGLVRVVQYLDTARGRV